MEQNFPMKFRELYDEKYMKFNYWTVDLRKYIKIHSVLIAI